MNGGVITDLEIHDAIMIELCVLIDGSAFVKFKSLHVSMREDSWDCEAMLTCTQVRGVEIDGALPEDGWIYDYTITAANGEDRPAQALLSDLSVSRIEIQLHNGTRIKIHCGVARISVEDGSVGSKRWGAR